MKKWQTLRTCDYILVWYKYKYRSCSFKRPNSLAKSSIQSTDRVERYHMNIAATHIYQESRKQSCDNSTFKTTIAHKKEEVRR